MRRVGIAIILLIAVAVWLVPTSVDAAFKLVTLQVAGMV